MTAERQLVENVVGKSYPDLDSETLRYAMFRITDTVGALLGGVCASGASMVLDIVRGWGGKEESTVLGVGERFPAANAALVMGITARSNDYEPAGGPLIDGVKSPGHYSATSVPTAFAIAEKMGLGGKDIIAAVVLGDDLASRIGTAGAGPWDLGWDPAGTCSRFAATAIAGKLMGLDENQMLNALGIALTQVGGTMLPVYRYTHCFNISQGLSAWNGILSAELARRGFTGPEDFLFGRFGYYQQFCREVRSEILTRDLGEKYYGDEEFKMYPCCRGVAGPIEASQKLVREHDIDSEKIDGVEIELPAAMKGSFLLPPFEPGPSLQATAILNIAYNVASVILRKDVGLEYYRDTAILDPRIKKLADIISVNVTDERGQFSRIRVRMRDGAQYCAETGEPRGAYFSKPITMAEVKAKFLESAAFSGAVSREQAIKALNMLDKLENLENLDGLIKELTP